MSDMKSLRVLVNEVSEIENALLDNGGEITPEIEAMLSVKDIQLPQKVDNYALVIQRMDSLESFYKDRAKVFLAMAKAASSITDRCKFNLKSAMEELAVDELLGNDIKFKLVNSNPACVIEDESKIDGAYKIIETVIKTDNRRIIEDLKLGVPVAGARLERGRSLRQYPNSPNSKKAVKS